MLFTRYNLLPDKNTQQFMVLLTLLKTLEKTQIKEILAEVLCRLTKSI